MNNIPGTLAAFDCVFGGPRPSETCDEFHSHGENHNYSGPEFHDAFGDCPGCPAKDVFLLADGFCEKCSELALTGIDPRAEGFAPFWRDGLLKQKETKTPC